MIPDFAYAGPSCGTITARRRSEGTRVQALPERTARGLDDNMDLKRLREMRDDEVPAQRSRRAIAYEYGHGADQAATAGEDATPGARAHAGRICRTVSASARHVARGQGGPDPPDRAYLEAIAGDHEGVQRARRSATPKSR